jgi:hypothetical protein
LKSSSCSVSIHFLPAGHLEVHSAKKELPRKKIKIKNADSVNRCTIITIINPSAA